jgi:hypothetical protein
LSNGKPYRFKQAAEICKNSEEGNIYYPKGDLLKKADTAGCLKIYKLIMSLYFDKREPDRKMLLIAGPYDLFSFIKEQNS